MIIFHDVNIDVELTRDHPLYVGHFFQLKGMWWSTRKKRQRFIIAVATAWHRVLRNTTTPGFLRDELYLTAATSKVRGARQIIEHFFKIERLGYNLGGGKNSPTIVSPRKLGKRYHNAITHLNVSASFDPGRQPDPTQHVVSEVTIIDPSRRQAIIVELQIMGRAELIPAVEWLFDYGKNIPFYYRPAGLLQARDTSVWPIRGIETWPSWLRAELFGTTIDIENAYCQFLIQQLEEKYKDNMDVAQLKYVDLFALTYDKQKFREELCSTYLKLPINSKNIAIVKRIIMALANGSNATGMLMVNGSNCQVANVINMNCSHLSNIELHDCGERLHRLAKQLRAAKRDLCFHLFNERPTRANQRKIFQQYFEWERTARYQIWEVCGSTGLMMHDGLDGIQTLMSSAELSAKVAASTNLRVEVKTPHLKMQREPKAPSLSHTSV